MRGVDRDAEHVGGVDHHHLDAEPLAGGDRLALAARLASAYPFTLVRCLG
jgi:hypothetical protein